MNLTNPNSSSNSLFREINIPFFKRFQRLVEDLRQIKHLIASWDHIIIISYQIWRSTSPKSPTSMRRWRQGHGLLRTILHPSENISCSFFQIFHHDHLNAIMTPEEMLKLINKRKHNQREVHEMNLFCDFRRAVVRRSQ